MPFEQMAEPEFADICRADETFMQALETLEADTQGKTNAQRLKQGGSTASRGRS